MRSSALFRQQGLTGMGDTMHSHEIQIIIQYNALSSLSKARLIPLRARRLTQLRWQAWLVCVIILERLVNLQKESISTLTSAPWLPSLPA